MQIKRAYKFRFYPSKEQALVLAHTFGCARFVYNYFLKYRTDAWYNEQKRLNYHDTSAELTRMKRNPEFSWLCEVSSVPVQQSLRHLQNAFSRFFSKRSEYPTFHTKHGMQSATYVASGFTWTGNQLILAKMVDPLNIRFSKHLPESAKVTTVTVSKDTAGRYFVSMLCDDEVVSLPKRSESIGIDLGLTHFAILSTGDKISSHNILRKNETKLAKLQRSIAKKRKGSKNRTKAKLKLARLHARIADARKDFLHKLSTQLIRENQTIAVETLAVKNMVKNRNMAKSISDASWSEFVRQLEYKSHWYGRKLVGIDRWYPSSKRCSSCGFVISKLPLSVRFWTCPECGSTHDRDVNAARNILAAGLAVSALGESVSPAIALA